MLTSSSYQSSPVWPLPWHLPVHCSSFQSPAAPSHTSPPPSQNSTNIPPTNLCSFLSTPPTLSLPLESPSLLFCYDGPRCSKAALSAINSHQESARGSLFELSQSTPLMIATLVSIMNSACLLVLMFMLILADSLPLNCPSCSSLSPIFSLSISTFPSLFSLHSISSFPPTFISFWSFPFLSVSVFPLPKSFWSTHFCQFLTHFCHFSFWWFFILRSCLKLAQTHWGKRRFCFVLNDFWGFFYLYEWVWSFWRDPEGMVYEWAWSLG